MARVYGQWTKDLRDIPFEQAKKQIVRGQLSFQHSELIHPQSEGIGPCFVSDNLGKEQADEEIIRNAAAMAYLGWSPLQCTPAFAKLIICFSWIRHREPHHLRRQLVPPKRTPDCLYRRVIYPCNGSFPGSPGSCSKRNRFCHERFSTSRFR